MLGYTEEGYQYWYNTLTGESSWYQPAGAPAAPGAAEGEVEGVADFTSQDATVAAVTNEAGAEVATDSDPFGMSAEAPSSTSELFGAVIGHVAGFMIAMMRPSRTAASGQNELAHRREIDKVGRRRCEEGRPLRA